MEDFSIYPLGDQALTFTLGNSIKQTDHQKIQAMKRWLEQRPVPGLLDIIVAYSSITITYDLYQLKQSASSGTAFEFAAAKLREAYHGSDYSEGAAQKNWEVPVCYEDFFAPDLHDVASFGGITTDDVIALHTSRIYQVYMIGFLPGFPYMAEVDRSIAAPRKERPRALVEAGSVGIAGVQTGIYPLSSPGGWQIIGRTPFNLFDRSDNPPVKFESGHHVQFYAITKKEFEDLSRRAA
jgi:inhibitor of KinA